MSAVCNCYARRTHAYAEPFHYIENTHGCCLIIKTTNYTEDTTDIRCHKETRNSYKYDLQTPPSNRLIRDKNTKSVPSSMYHNL